MVGILQAPVVGFKDAQQRYANSTQVVFSGGQTHRRPQVYVL